MTRSANSKIDTRTSEPNSSEKGSATTRRKFMSVTAGGAALAAILGRGATTKTAQADLGSFSIEVAGPQMDAIRKPQGEAPRPTGPFYVEAPIYPEGTLDADGIPQEDGAQIGTFRCWGWIYSAEPFGASVSQEFELDNLGTLTTHGREGTDKRAVTGGTEMFAGASGEATVAFISHENPSFQATFDLS